MNCVITSRVLIFQFLLGTSPAVKVLISCPSELASAHSPFKVSKFSSRASWLQIVLSTIAIAGAFGALVFHFGNVLKLGLYIASAKIRFETNNLLEPAVAMLDLFSTFSFIELLISNSST